MIIPMQAEDATNPAANLPEYFCSFMAGIRMLPSAEVSAEDEPLTPPKIMLATTITAASPPGRKPTSAFEKFTIRRVSPTGFHDGPGEHEEWDGRGPSSGSPGTCAGR